MLHTHKIIMELWLSGGCMKFFKIMIVLFIFFASGSAAAEQLLSEKFTITSIQYRSSDSANLTRYEDCEDCMLILGAVSEGCGSGFVVKGSTSGSEEEKFLKSLVMMAYASGKQVQIGRSHCIKWNGSYRGQVNRVYIH